MQDRLDDIASRRMQVCFLVPVMQDLWWFWSGVCGLVGCCVLVADALTFSICRFPRRLAMSFSTLFSVLRHK